MMEDNFNETFVPMCLCVALFLLFFKYSYDGFNAKYSAAYSPVKLFERVYESKDVFYLTCVVKTWKVWGFEQHERQWICAKKEKNSEVVYFLSDEQVPHRFKDHQVAVDVSNCVLAEIEEKRQKNKVVSFKEIEIV